jgi:5-methylcytosine-specific restriction enzyme subunit McrC
VNQREPLVFHDLVGPERAPTHEEDAWLAELVRETDAVALTIRVAASNAADEPEPILRRELDGWRAGRFVGELLRGGRVLEIRPRLGVETLAAWAGAALNLRIIARAAEHRGTAALIAELLAATWRSAVVEAARHGPPGLRAEQAHVGAHARGRLHVPRTLGLRAARRPLIASVDRPKHIDNPVARAIVLADRVLDRRLARPGWRGERIEELLPRLHAATGQRPALPARRELDRVRYTPITLPYRRAAELSWEIARHHGLRATATGEKSEGLLIDVAELWELFLLHCARRAYGSANVTHGTRLRDAWRLLRSVSHPAATLGRLYPDIVVGPPERPTAVIDAKYKPLVDPRGVDREDLYQLTSYLSARPTYPPPAGLLAYHRYAADDRTARAEERGPWRSTQGHTISFLRLSVDEAGCVAALSALPA